MHIFYLLSLFLVSSAVSMGTKKPATQLRSTQSMMCLSTLESMPASQAHLNALKAMPSRNNRNSARTSDYNQQSITFLIKDEDEKRALAAKAEQNLTRLHRKLRRTTYKKNLTLMAETPEVKLLMAEIKKFEYMRTENQALASELATLIATRTSTPTDDNSWEHHNFNINNYSSEAIKRNFWLDGAWAYPKEDYLLACKKLIQHNNPDDRPLNKD